MEEARLFYSKCGNLKKRDQGEKGQSCPLCSWQVTTPLAKKKHSERGGEKGGGGGRGLIWSDSVSSSVPSAPRRLPHQGGKKENRKREGRRTAAVIFLSPTRGACIRRQGKEKGEKDQKREGGEGGQILDDTSFSSPCRPGCARPKKEGKR